MLLCEPMTVASPSPVALWMVTHSRIVLCSPISVRVRPPFHFRSWVLSPMLAKGKISFSCPNRVCPSITTWEYSRQPGPSSTCSPITQYGPISQSAPTCALGCIIAVGCTISLSRFKLPAAHCHHFVACQPLPFKQHEGHGRLTHHFSPHFANPFGLADLAAYLRQLNINHQHIPRLPRLAPFHIPRRHEIGHLACVLGVLEHKDSSHLRHGLQLQHPGHYRVSGEMPLKVRLVYRDVLDADNVIAIDLRNAIHH